MAKKKSDAKSLEASGNTEELKKRPIRFEYLNIDLIVPNAWNPNAQDELTFNLLQDEIAEVGLIDPIEVVPLEDGMFRIIGGEHRWRAAKNLGYFEVPCIILTDNKWTEEDLQKFVTVRLNVIHGKLDPEKFLTLYKEMAGKYGEEAMQRMMGYADSKAFQRTLGWVKKGLKESLPKEMAKEVEDATKEVKSVADLEKIIQDLFNKYGETVNQSFMVFTYGKQQHIYIQMSAKLRRAMDKVMTFSNVACKDINEVLERVILQALPELSRELEEVQRSQSEAPKVIKEEW